MGGLEEFEGQGKSGFNSVETYWRMAQQKCLCFLVIVLPVRSKQGSRIYSSCHLACKPKNAFYKWWKTAPSKNKNPTDIINLRNDIMKTGSSYAKQYGCGQLFASCITGYGRGQPVQGIMPSPSSSIETNFGEHCVLQYENEWHLAYVKTSIHRHLVV